MLNFNDYSFKFYLTELKLNFMYLNENPLLPHALLITAAFLPENQADALDSGRLFEFRQVRCEIMRNTQSATASNYKPLSNKYPYLDSFKGRRCS